jgi:hypothetical protein
MSKFFIIGLFLLTAFGQNAFAQDCTAKLSTFASGQMLESNFTAKANASGNAYRNGKPTAKLPNSAANQDEMKLMATFNTAVRQYFVNASPETLEQTTFTLQKGELADGKPCRNLVATFSDGVLVSLPITEFQAMAKSKGGPVQGVKVGLGKNPSGSFAAATDSDSKWNINFNETAFAEVLNTVRRTNPRMTSDALKAQFTKEFTTALNRWFPRNSTIPTNQTRRTQ